MEQQSLIFTFYKQNCFRLTQYNATIQDEILLFQQVRQQITKYKISLGYHFNLKWILHSNQSSKQTSIEGFMFVYQGCEKKFVGNSRDLYLFRKILKKKISFLGLNLIYQIKNVLNFRNDCKVYQIESLLNGKYYAVKQISSQKSQRALNEIHINNLLKNDFITKLKEVYSENNNYYLVFEINQGGTLQELLDNTFEEISEGRIKQIMKQLMMALQFLLQNKIAHLDLKPSNVMFKMMGNFQTLRIIDFGLANQTDQQNSQINGTPGYIAPELFQKSTIKNCDMFGAGCIFFYLLFRKPLIQGHSQWQIMKKNQLFNIASIEKLLKKKNNSCADLLRKMLLANPQTRIMPEEALQHPYFTKNDSSDYGSDEDLQNYLSPSLKLNKTDTQQKWEIFEVDVSEPIAKIIPKFQIRYRNKTK